MAQDSKIEWTHHTVNLWWGCTKVHEGCDNCYAEALSHRFGDDVWGNDKSRKEIKSAFKDLDKYQKLAKSKNEVHRVFIGSMMDIFEKPMPLMDGKGNARSYDTGKIRELLFMNIDFGKYPNLLFLFLTKRPSNINKYIPEFWKENPPSNVMFGTSPVSQETANKLIVQLLQVNGCRFLSVEPQLEEIDLRKVPTGIIPINSIHWIIQGGESGHHKRLFNLDWAYKLKEQCREAKIPYFFKQIDKIQPIPEDLLYREFPKQNIIHHETSN